VTFTRSASYYTSHEDAHCSSASTTTQLSIHNDLVATGVVTLTEARIVLGRYTASWGYLRNCTAGAQRIGLDGEPAGVVTEEEAARAAERLAASRAAVRERRKNKIQAEKPIAAKPSSSKAENLASVGRLSLADFVQAHRLARRQ
jgi:sRNA-binding protein